MDQQVLIEQEPTATVYRPLNLQQGRRGRRLRFALISCTFFCCLLIIAVVVFCVLVAIRRPVDLFPLSSTIDRDHIQFDRNGIVAPVLVTLNGINDNFYDIQLDLIRFTATSPFYNGNVVTGTLSSIVLPRRSDNTLVSGVLHVSYLFGNDPQQRFLNAINKNCTAGGDGLGIYLDATLDVTYAMFLKSGQETFKRDIVWSCNDIMSAM